MDLLVAGAGPAYTDRLGSTGAAYLLRTGNEHLLLDLGQGSFPRIASELDPAALLGVVISHLHPDHFIDLVPLRHYLRYECQPPRQVAVFAPADLERRLDALLGEPGFCSAALRIELLSAGSNSVGPFDIQARLVTHTNESYAFRATAGDGPGLVYSGDCGRETDLIPLVEPGDTLLCEVSFGTDAVPDGALHLNADGVGRLAAATRPSQVVLTHLQMGHDPEETMAGVAAEYNGPIRFVWPGDRLTI
jgi:ribonuclease BN (tRNA processing enzyme)